MKNKTTLNSKVPNVVLRKKKSANAYSLFLDIHFKGKRHKEYLKLYISLNKSLSEEDKLTLRLAEKIQTKRKLELQSNFYNEPDFNPTKRELLPFIDQVIANNPQWRPNSVKKYKILKTHIKSHDDSVIYLNDIDKAWINGLKNYFLARHKRNTADRYFSAFITILNKAVEENILKYNPSLGIKRIGKDKSLPKFLTLEEVVKLSKKSIRNNEIRRAFLFSCFTGLRLSDIKNLKWKNIYQNQGKTYIKFVQVKTSGPVNTPISEQALFYLGDYGDPEEFVFKLPNDANVDKSIKSWGRRAELSESLSFHKARHTFGTLSAISEVNIHTTSDMMGHSDIRQTLIYSRVVNSMKEKAVSLLPTFDDQFDRKSSDKVIDNK